MKKIKAMFILFVLSSAIMTGCTAIKNAVTAKSPHLNEPFTCNFSITAFDDMELDGTLSRYGSGLWDMDITAPETMAGLHISRDDAGMSVSLGELEIAIEPQKINNGAAAELIFAAIDSCAVLENLSLNDAEDGLEYIGKVSECAYVMIFDRDTMELKRLSFPGLNITAEFSGHSCLTSSTNNPTMSAETTAVS